MDLDLPRPSLGLVITTQVFLGTLFLAGLTAIAPLLPGFSSNVPTSLPEYAELRDPLLAITIALTILGLIALAMVALLVHRIYTGTMLITIDHMLTQRGMSVGEFADRVGITPANVAVLKNGRAKAVRFSTLDAICRVLECQPGDILHHGG